MILHIRDHFNSWRCKCRWRLFSVASVRKANAKHCGWVMSIWGAGTFVLPYVYQSLWDPYPKCVGTRWTEPKEENMPARTSLLPWRTDEEMET